MSEMFALFMWEPGEAFGGVNDLVMIGTMEQCVFKAEAEVLAGQIGKTVSIVRMEDLREVRHGSVAFVESYLTAVPHSSRLEWDWEESQ